MAITLRAQLRGTFRFARCRVLLSPNLSRWVLLATLPLLLIATYVGWRMRRQRAKEEKKQYQEELSRADYEGMTREDDA
jgi:membrane protein implicated in regulation of membrane protease activity